MIVRKQLIRQTTLVHWQQMVPENGRYAIVAIPKRRNVNKPFEKLIVYVVCIGSRRLIERVTIFHQFFKFLGRPWCEELVWIMLCNQAMNLNNLSHPIINTVSQVTWQRTRIIHCTHQVGYSLKFAHGRCLLYVAYDSSSEVWIIRMRGTYFLLHFKVAPEIRYFFFGIASCTTELFPIIGFSLT